MCLLNSPTSLAEMKRVAETMVVVPDSDSDNESPSTRPTPKSKLIKVVSVVRLPLPPADPPLEIPKSIVSLKTDSDAAEVAPCPGPHGPYGPYGDQIPQTPSSPHSPTEWIFLYNLSYKLSGTYNLVNQVSKKKMFSQKQIKLAKKQI